MNRHLQIENQIGELNRVATFLEELGEEWNIPMAQVLSVNVALEEAISNIIFYGYDDKENHFIDLEVTFADDELSILISDDGHEFDPTRKADPDLTLSVEDMPIGGLGIFMIKKIMNRVEYHRTDNKNHLQLTKQIES